MKKLSNILGKAAALTEGFADVRHGLEDAVREVWPSPSCASCWAAAGATTCAAAWRAAWRRPECRIYQASSASLAARSSSSPTTVRDLTSPSSHLHKDTYDKVRNYIDKHWHRAGWKAAELKLASDLAAHKAKRWSLKTRSAEGKHS